MPGACVALPLKRWWNGLTYLRLKPDGHLGFTAVTFFTVLPLMQAIVIFLGVGLGVGVTIVDVVGDGAGSTLDLLDSH